MTRSAQDLQSAFIAGMDKCREIHEAYGEWPSLTGRVDLAQDAYGDVAAGFVPPFFFVFDIESVGLHGEPFAAGWVVIETATGNEVDSGIAVSDFERAASIRKGGIPVALERDVEWVKAHVLPSIAGVPIQSKIQRAVWNRWRHWEARGALLAADVPWPVEARFLMQCVLYTSWIEGKRNVLPGPYPLIDIASVRLAKGFDPIATELREENEEPAHNPLADARQSARLLMEALRA